MSDAPSLGIVGLGAMGLPLARLLRGAGYPLKAYNRTRSRAEPLLAAGVTLADSPGGVADPGGIAITILSDDDALEEVTLGEGGLLGRLGEGGVHLSMSTVSPETSRRLAALHAGRGESYLAAPVFGRPDAAAEGRLTVCLAGPEAARARVAEVLAVVSQGVFEFGEEPAAANVVKLAGNFLIGAAIEAMAEAFTLAEKNGISRSSMHELFSSTLFACPVYQSYGRLVSEQRYEPAGFRMPLGLKDISLVLQAAWSSVAPMPVANLLHDRLAASVAKGRTELDWAGIGLEVSEAAGL